MKNFKNALLIVMIASLLMPVMEGCKKYEEGPMISFKSKKARISGIWKITDRKVAGTSVPQTYYSDLTVEFTQDGFYQEKSAADGIQFEGQWQLNGNKTKIGIRYDGETEYEYFKIVKLKGKEFWLKGEDGDDELEIQYEPA